VYSLFTNDDCRVAAIPYKLDFKFPFKLAVGTRSFTDIIILKITRNGYVGYGEAAMPPYLGATVESTLGFYKSLDWNSIINLSLSEAHDLIDLNYQGNNAAKASIDIALHDLHCQKEQITLRDFYKIASQHPIYSTYTIGISTEKELIAKLEDGKDFK